MLGCNNDRLFFSIRNMVFHCTFLGKKAIIITSTPKLGPFFPLQFYSKKTLRKNVQKSARKYKRNVLMAAVSVDRSIARIEL